MEYNRKQHDSESPLLIGHLNPGEVVKEARQESYIDYQLRLFLRKGRKYGGKNSAGADHIIRKMERKPGNSMGIRSESRGMSEPAAGIFRNIFMTYYPLKRRKTFRQQGTESGRGKFVRGDGEKIARDTGLWMIFGVNEKGTERNYNTMAVLNEKGNLAGLLPETHY